MSSSTPPEPKGTSVLQISPAAVWEEIHGQVVAWHEDNESLHRLTGSGVAVFLSLNGESTLEEISKELTADFAADVDAVRRDVLTFAAELLDLGLAEAKR